jgi:DNA uptake protein ComE-like DNA-binding protein
MATAARMSNAEIAAALREAAALLRAQGASPFRVAAYEKAADTVEALPQSVSSLAAGGLEALDGLPHIGRTLASAILEMLATGRWVQLERLRGASDPETLLQVIPGVGPGLARRIHDHLDCATLEALEAAAHDGRLAAVPGIGPRRAAAILLGVSGLLNRKRPVRMAATPAPSVPALLDVDREYREKAAAGALRLIAPKRFNPEGKAWLPVLHTERGPWHFTALFSNTARAHDLNKTSDWVVIFYATDSRPEGQCTVVTETSGPHRGLRVVRGREQETPPAAGEFR